MQDDQPHAAQDSALDALDHGVIHLLVRLVAPPEEHVSGLQHSLGEPVLGLVERGDAGGKAVLLQAGGQDGVDALGIDGAHGLVAALVAELVPDRDARLAHRSPPPRPPKPGGSSSSSRTGQPPRAADRRQASTSARLPTLSRPELNRGGTLPLRTARAKAAMVPARSCSGNMTSSRGSAGPPRRWIASRSEASRAPLLPRQAQVAAPSAKSIAHSPPQGVAGPRLSQLAR